MIIDYTLRTYYVDLPNGEKKERKERVPNISDEEASKYIIRFNKEIDAFEAELPTEEKLRQEFEKKDKLLQKRITDSADYSKLKQKITKVNDSEGTPTKWADKVKLLEGEHIDHKGIIYEVLKDHTASKEAEPPQRELYKEL